MKVSVPKEVKNNEFRVAITPAGVAELTRHGHEVFVQAGAGEGSLIPDADYVAQGATMVPTAAETWAVGEMVMKVKEPIASEYGYLREDLTLFTYLHLAADKPQTEALLASKTTAIAYAVSYTHLDVYKRQASSRSTTWTPSRRPWPCLLYTSRCV